MKISLVIPMYNESSVLPTTLKKVSEYMAANFDDYEVIFANDGSRDNSADIVKNFEDEHIKLGGYEVNQGKGCAVRTGMLEATGDIVMFTDCDLAYELGVVDRAVKMFEESSDSDLVIGSRSIHKEGYEGYSFVRKLASKTFLTVLRVIGGLRCSDSQTGFKAFRGEAARKIFSKCETNGFAFDFEVILIAQKYGMKISEMPVKIINQNDSKVNVIKDTMKMIKDILRIKKRVKKLELTDK
ncbi:MAG: glycosyltransferase [Clostridia bacterium]|nr:glycosyltransferase [Clostridia bacterium]